MGHPVVEKSSFWVHLCVYITKHESKFSCVISFFIEKDLETFDKLDFFLKKNKFWSFFCLIFEAWLDFEHSKLQIMSENAKRII